MDRKAGILEKQVSVILIIIIVVIIIIIIIIIIITIIIIIIINQLLDFGSSFYELRKISFSLSFFQIFPTRYLRCPSAMTVNVLKKFLVMKFAIPNTHQVIRQFGAFFKSQINGKKNHDFTGHGVNVDK